MTDNDRSILAAVASLRPGAAWNFNYGNGLAGLVWLDPHIARPDDAELTAEIARLAAMPAPAAAAPTPATVAPRATAAAQQLDQHLTSAIADLSPPKEKPVMRGMERLANLHETAVGDIDAIADAAADEIVAAKAYAKEAVAKYSQEAAKIRKMADGIMAQLGQTSNSAVAGETAEQTSTAAASLPQVKISG